MYVLLVKRKCPASKMNAKTQGLSLIDLYEKNP